MGKPKVKSGWAGYLKEEKQIKITAIGENQKRYLDALLDDSVSIVIAEGCAGTGKTMIAATVAINKLNSGAFDRIVVSRPIIESCGEKLGYLPGSLLDKIQPYIEPVYDVLRDNGYIDYQIEQLIKQRKLDPSPLAYQRGRTHKSCIMFLDEAQNTTPDQMKMWLTRMGVGSRIFITGDSKQHDRGSAVNGLTDLLSRVKDNNFVSVTRFNKDDIRRHENISTILGWYGE